MQKVITARKSGGEGMVVLWAVVLVLSECGVLGRRDWCVVGREKGRKAVVLQRRCVDTSPAAHVWFAILDWTVSDGCVAGSQSVWK